MTEYTGKIFAAQMTRDVNGPWQRILLDRVPKTTRQQIERIYLDAMPVNQNSIPKMSSAAKKISLGLERVLPYVGSDNVFEFMKLQHGEQAGAWHTYGDYFKRQHKLSQITDGHHQDCVVHGLNTLLTIQDDGWRPYHELARNGRMSRHIALAKEVDEFMIVIDIQRGENPDKYQSDALYTQPCDIFNRKYFPVNILTRSELRQLRASLK